MARCWITASSCMAAASATATRIRTPICFDESLEQPADVPRAAALGACRIANIKIQRVGGLANALFSYLIAFLLYMMLMLYGQQILRGVMEEKTSRVAEVVISSVSTDTLLAGKVIGVGGASLTQIFVWTISSALSIPTTLQPTLLISSVV